jgi:hypothetical protein
MLEAYSFDLNSFVEVLKSGSVSPPTWLFFKSFWASQLVNLSVSVRKKKGQLEF